MRVDVASLPIRPPFSQRPRGHGGACVAWRIMLVTILGCAMCTAVDAAPAGPTASAVTDDVSTAGNLSAIQTGIYIPDAPHDASPLNDFEALVGRQMSIVHWYQPWGYTNGTYQPALDTMALAAVAARSATPLITWEAWGPVNGIDPAHVANIPTGVFDTYIDSWAQGLKAFGQPVYLRPFHEMNNEGYPWAFGVNGNTADDLVAAWRYIHDRFTRAGATNVRWVWCPNPDNGRVAYSALYPGDAYVDWFGLDVYNGGAQFDWGGWQSAQQIAARSYGLLQALNPDKPMMFAETSSVEQGGSKAQWITDLFRSTPTAFPNLRAIIWFDANWATQDSRNLPIADWRVNTSSAALQAYRGLWPQTAPNPLPATSPPPPASASGQRPSADASMSPPALLPPSR
jgi:hypothetical protein